MSKPEDISQEAWDIADAVLMESPLTMVPVKEWAETQALIARCILAAEQRDRERIAEWADATADHYDASAIVDSIGDVAPNRAAEKALRGFATAIRGSENG